jgi:trehalose-phosphatase
VTGSRTRKVSHTRLISKPTHPFKSRHLFDHWEQVQRRIVSADRLVLFLDFDGTITPLRPKPDDVKLKQSTRLVLRRLARHPSVTLCFVSGRPRVDLKNLVKVSGALYVGLHGWERDAGKRSTIAAPHVLRRARRLLVVRLAGLPHVKVGDKGPCFDVHYHGATDATIRKARAIVYGVFRSLRGHARILKGRDVWEFLPREFEGKGAAVRDLLAEIPSPVLPVYVGDDTTDEFGFGAVPNGITIRVGKPRRTRARYELRNPEEVISFLQKLEVLIA